MPVTDVSEGGAPLDLGLKFERPTSVFVGGEDRALLNWCALALARQCDPQFFWTDVRIAGEVLDPRDPLASSVLPPARYHTVEPPSLSRDERSAEIARRRSGEILRADDPSDARNRLIGFLGLPTHTQDLLAGGAGGRSPRCVVLSNAHRLIALYPTTSVEPTVRAIVQYGATLIATFADAAPEGRWAFDTVLQVSGKESARWRTATLRIERLNGGPRRSPATEIALPEIEPIAPMLAAQVPS